MTHPLDITIIKIGLVTILSGAGLIAVGLVYSLIKEWWG